MTSPLYIQQGPSPTWWNSPAIWLTAQGDPSTGPKVISPIVGKPYTVWVEIQNFYMEADTGGWNLFVCWGIPFTGTLPSVNIGQILNGAMTSAGPQGADHRHHPWRDFDVARDRYSPSGDNLDADPAKRRSRVPGRGGI